MRVSFNWLKDYVDIHVPAQAVAEKLTMAGLEVTSTTRLDGDIIWEIEVTPNRVDCLSIVGIAREVTAIFGKKLKLPKIPFLRGSAQASLPIQIQDRDKCPRYLGRVIKNVQVRPSPEWLIRRLEAMGIRAVNNIVDITNFCLLEFGQPLHTFDLDKLQGPRIVVRTAQPAEKIVTIDGVQRELQPGMLVIADKLNPVAIAGIMGGKDSEVSETTAHILLESAYFEPLGIRATSRKLGLASQSSYRFERGVDFACVPVASLRAAELIQKLAKRPERKSKAVVIGKLIDTGRKQRPQLRVQLRTAKVGEVLGVEVAPPQIKDYLQRLGFSVVRKSKQMLVVTVPSFRTDDITREADLIEELARLFGYDRIPLSTSCLSAHLSAAAKPQLNAQEADEAIRRILVSFGLNEIMTYSLISRQALRRLELPEDKTAAIANPLSYEQELLRPSLLVGMLNALQTNINRKNTNLKLFELSRVYLKDVQARIQEVIHLCIGLAGHRGENWLARRNQLNFFDLKGIIETLFSRLGIENVRFAPGECAMFIPGRCASVFLGDVQLGFLGELKREVLDKFDLAEPAYAAELEVQKLVACVRPEQKFKPLAKFPSVERDISLVAPQEVCSEKIISVINKIGRDLIAKVVLFDQYFGEQIPPGSRGLAYSIEYRSQETTLSAEEVDKLHQRIRSALSEELGVQLR